jgi:hypothetical protein
MPNAMSGTMTLKRKKRKIQELSGLCAFTWELKLTTRIEKKNRIAARGLTSNEQGQTRQSLSACLVLAQVRRSASRIARTSLCRNIAYCFKDKLDKAWLVVMHAGPISKCGIVYFIKMSLPRWAFLHTLSIRCKRVL